MNNYLVLVRGSGPGFEALSEEERGGIYEKWGAFIAKLSEGGHWVKGNPLDDSGRLICSANQPQEGIVGDPDVAVGGFFILAAEDYDHALKLCEGCPAFGVDGKLEIRESVEM